MTELRRMVEFPADAMMQRVGPVVLLQRSAQPASANPKLHEMMSRTVTLDGKRPVARQVLSLVLGVDDGVVIPLGAQDPDGSFTIGRAVDAAVRLDDPAVSGHHALVRYDGWKRQVWVSDLGSTNGTRVNGRRIAEETELIEGDAFTVGDSSAFLVLTTDTLHALLRQHAVR
ncbi:MAG: FHA domain-containing protein [Archangium sp.]|nr:FHA domain-containing protein [Archangium sp.]